MIDLKLLPGPVLRYHAFPMPEARDVTAAAHRFLFDVVEVSDGVRLQDVIGLFEACPSLVDLFARSYADAVVKEAQLGPLPDDDEPLERIEHLSVRQTWSVNTLTREHEYHHLELVGIGPVLAEDAPDYHVKAGDRITWGLSAATLRKLLTLPLVIEKTASIQEADMDAKRWHEVVANISVPHLRLGELINAIFDTLTFHGGPEESKEFAAEIRAQVDDIKEHPEKAITVDDDDFLFGDDRPAVAEMFTETAAHSVRDISYVVRQLEDADNAATALESTLAGATVASAYRTLTGREFRKAFREVRSEERTAKLLAKLEARRNQAK